MNVYEGCGEDDFEENLSKYFFPTHLSIFQSPCFLYFLILTNGRILMYVQQYMAENKNSVKS